MRKYLIVLLSVFQLSCIGMPEGIRAVDNFELNRYLGQWHEIARLDHSFERGLEKVTATYALREGGGIVVTNKGYSAEKGEWKTAEGKAFFVGDENIGHLKVSFFGPFYGAYVIFELDEQDYQYAYVTSYNKKYLWLLSRKPQLSQQVVDDFVARVRALGYSADQLIFVKQD